MRGALKDGDTSLVSLPQNCTFREFVILLEIPELNGRALHSSSILLKPELPDARALHN